ncbi:hypothetical protein NLM33_00340 [Bradyrhizobium sp. CCGUVB1N3]|uniref:hypothetical protein n=1 Tax=Bradyrhizobium sp. CCGUVB1N3 TaxID=2949629 RepID=UPI0020B20875|nr:hypothetical protein [Bradyrhizobium sp. CCGUVB1N3]MCP3468766.1 hypothetical protein [Bradyrhizobium sp. CCGUVB1N3]
MKHYRAFQIDPDGHVFGCINLVCDGEEDAKRKAQTLVSFYRIELWRLDQRIAKFEAVSQMPDRVTQLHGQAVCASLR